MAFDQSSLQNFPAAPGVYLMKNRAGEVLYVGKAKNLRLRVKQYFVPGRDGREMVPHLVAKVEAIETIVVMSEKEALLLENTLIKQHRPHFNALLKDDKTYVSLKMNTKHEWPMVRLVRYTGKPKTDGLYFGPYTGAYSARQTLELLQKLFPLRQCSDQELASRTRPCILYDMKRCIAPCVGRCSKEEYDGFVQQTIRFLRGQDTEVLKELERQMELASDSLDFERAAHFLQTIRAIEKTVEAQHVDHLRGGDADAYGIFREGEEVALSQLLIRSGKVVGNKNYAFSDLAQEDHELLESFLLQQYESADGIPREILVPVPLEGARALEEILSGRKAQNVLVHHPQRGDKRALVEMAEANAQASFRKERDAKVLREKMLLELEETLRLTRYPRRIECLDNSNLSGSEPVSALVAFTEAEKDTKRYRLYKLKPGVASDDYAAMSEVLTRRYRRAKEEDNLPDLLIIDGGKGQLNLAVKILSDLNISTVDIIGVAKEQGRHDRGVTSEQIFLPHARDPILLKSTSPILFLLQRIRDEAHRFVIAFQRKRRTKKTITTELGQIEGIGPAKRRTLLRHFGSVRALRGADEVAVRAVKGLSEANVQSLLKFIQS